MKKFPLGQLAMTQGVTKALGYDDTNREASQTIADLLRRHQSGDWGDVDQFDARTNDDAVRDGSRILSAYTVNGVKLWIITEADRSVTTLLLPEEY